MPGKIHGREVLMSEPYFPQLGIVYPEKPDDHMVPLIVKRDVVVDENYPFLDKSFKFQFVRYFINFVIFTLVFLFSPFMYGLKVEGRKNLRKHKKLFKNGAMTASNHVCRWDFLFIMNCVRYRTMYFPAWKEHLKGPDGWLIRASGGIPVPSDIKTMKCFNNAFDEIHEKKKWIHVFPESCRFDFFVPIRPFKKGVFSMAQRYNLPVIPIAFSYRPPGFPIGLVNFFRALKGGKQLPMVTARIGEPILLDPNLGRKEAIQKLRKDCHEAIVRLAGITNNPYPAEGD
jgi:1-acyl-sn-glycerol-3-phosphate acyltransferase